MEKQKVTVEFQNALCDKLYNRVQHAEFNWLEKYCKDKNDVWAELIETVDEALYGVIKEFFDNDETNDILVQASKNMLPDIDIQKILDGCK